MTLGLSHLDRLAREPKGFQPHICRDPVCSISTLPKPGLVCLGFVDTQEDAHFLEDSSERELIQIHVLGIGPELGPDVLLVVGPGLSAGHQEFLANVAKHIVLWVANALWLDEATGCCASVQSFPLCLLSKLAQVEVAELLAFLDTDQVLDEFFVAEEAVAVLTHGADQKAFDVRFSEGFAGGGLPLQGLVDSVQDVLLR